MARTKAQITAANVKQFVSEPKLATFVPLVNSFAMRNIPLTQDVSKAAVWARNTQELLVSLNGSEHQKKYGLTYKRKPSIFVGKENIMAGLFYSWHYEAEDPNYDEFPLTLILWRDSTHMLGLNFHYLPYAYRFAFFQNLIPLIAPVPVGIRSKIKADTSALKSYAEFKPCVKMYRLDRVQSRILFISPVEWPVAIAYPSGNFVGKTLRQVWNDSLRKMR